MRLYTRTFGCRVNQYETQSLREKLLVEGGVPAETWRDADLCVINTCTVTREADRDALKLVRQIARGNPAARLVVTGCYATRSPEEIRRAAPGALVVGNAEKDRIPAMLGCRTAPSGYSISDFHGKTRAFLKVQDGCNMHCSYCIIPSIRPTMSTKPLAEVLAEAKTLLAGGYKELVLCGVRLGRWLDDSVPGRRVDFPGLLRELLSLDGEFRIRLSSFEVTDVTARFLALYDEFPGKLCPYLHVPLQSGSDAILKRMERWYSSSFFERRIEAAREAVPGLSLFTDVMVAFPGETEAQHEENLAFVERIGFSGLHPFRFSARRGTKAARFKALPEHIVERRSREMRALDKLLRGRFEAREKGKRRTVLLETPKDGHTEHFLKVKLERSGTPGTFVRLEVP